MRSERAAQTSRAGIDRAEPIRTPIWASELGIFNCEETYVRTRY
jgi:hypothetical protein